MVIHIPPTIAGIIGGMVGTRAIHAGAMSVRTPWHRTFLKSPLIQGGGFGVGYTSGAYGGYGTTNTWDPFNLHKPKYKHYQQKLRLPYGSYGRSYGRYRRYRGYRRRSYYRRNLYRRSYRSYY